MTIKKESRHPIFADVVYEKHKVFDVEHLKAIATYRLRRVKLEVTVIDMINFECICCNRLSSDSRRLLI